MVHIMEKESGRRPNMEVNVGKLDRLIRIVVGVGLLSLVFVGPQTPLGWVGLILVLTGLMSRCPLYSLLGIKTCPVSRRA
jgi:hypothetical protein